MNRAAYLITGLMLGIVMVTLIVAAWWNLDTWPTPARLAAIAGIIGSGWAGGECFRRAAAT